MSSVRGRELGKHKTSTVAGGNKRMHISALTIILSLSDPHISFPKQIEHLVPPPPPNSRHQSSQVSQQRNQQDQLIHNTCSSPDTVPKLRAAVQKMKRPLCSLMNHHASLTAGLLSAGERFMRQIHLLANHSILLTCSSVLFLTNK